MSKATPKKQIVVYADDDQDDLLLVEQAFLEYASNVELKTCTDGSQALKYLSDLPKRSSLPCLIVLDINMPVMNGKKVLLELRKLKRFNKTSIVLFSTSSALEDKMFAIKYDAGYISKPMNMKQLEEIIKQFVAHCKDKSVNLIAA